MQYTVLILMLFGILANASWQVTRRYLLREQRVTELEIIIFQYGVGFFLLVSALLWWRDIGDIQVNQVLFWSAVLAAALINGFIHFANARASSLAEASLTAPVHSLTPVILAIAALVFFGENPSPQGWIGIFLVTAGLYMHGVRESWAEANNRSAGKWTVVSALAGVAGLIMGALIARSGSIIIGFAVQAGVLATAFGFLNRRKASARPLGQVWQKHWRWLLFYGVLFGLQTILLNTAFRFSLIANIGTLKRFNLLFIMLLSFWLLGEKRALPRLAPSLFIIVGTILLGFDSAGSSIVGFVEGLAK